LPSTMSQGKKESNYLDSMGLNKDLQKKLEKNGIIQDVIERLDPTTLNAMLKELDVPMDVRCKLLLMREEYNKEDDDGGKRPDGGEGPEKKKASFNLLNGWVGNKKELCYWVNALIICIFTNVAPTLIVGLSNFYGYDTPPEWMVNDPENHQEEILLYQLYRVILPALAILLVIFVFTPRFSLFLVGKLISNRSKGVKVKEVMTAMLANSGIISALLLTVVFTALQVDLPQEDAVGSFLNMYYSAFLLIAVFYSFTATIMSSICYLYMQPLNGIALGTFMGEMALYYGEPITGMIITLWLLLNATILWVWGQYGAGAGMCAVVIFYFFCVRVLVCIQNLHGWENVHDSAGKVEHFERGKFDVLQSTKQKEGDDGSA